MPSSVSEYYDNPSQMAGRTIGVWDANFNFTRLGSQHISKLTFFYDGVKFNGIKVFNENGDECNSFGTLVGSSDSISFDADSFITSYTIYGTNWGNGRVCGIKVTIADRNGGEKSYPIGKQEGELNKIKNDYPTGVKLIGIIGWAGSDLDALNLIVSHPVASYRWTNFNYKPIDLSKLPPSQFTTAFYNSYTAITPPGYTGATLAPKIDVTTSNTYTMNSSYSVAKTLGGNAGGSFSSPTTTGGPGFSGNVNYSSTDTDANGKTITKTETFTLSSTYNLALRPGSKSEVDVLVTHANFSIDFTADLECTFRDGKVQTFPDKGKITAVSFYNISYQARSPVDLTPEEIARLGNSSAPIVSLNQ